VVLCGNKDGRETNGALEGLFGHGPTAYGTLKPNSERSARVTASNLALMDSRGA